MNIWRTCTQCGSKRIIALKEGEKDYDPVSTYCPYCNMNKNGDEKGKPGKGLRKSK